MKTWRASVEKIRRSKWQRRAYRSLESFFDPRIDASR